MNQPLIVLGDRTSHGGTVIGADMTVTINGKAAARVGDMTVCPRCKGQFPIVSGPGDLVDGFDNAYAHHGDKTACGASLIASQPTTTWSAESSVGIAGDGDSDTALGMPAAFLGEIGPAMTDSGICLECMAAAAASGSAVLVRD